MKVSYCKHCFTKISKVPLIINGKAKIKLIIPFVFSMNYLDKRLDNFQRLIDEKFPSKALVIMLIDNVNMYRGTRRQ